MSSHTKEPWATLDCGNSIAICAGERGVVTRIENTVSGRPISQEDEANARRIVACVNACAGIGTEYLEHIGLGGMINRLHDVEDERDQPRSELTCRIEDSKKAQALAEAANSLAGNLQHKNDQLSAELDAARAEVSSVRWMLKNAEAAHSLDRTNSFIALKSELADGKKPFWAGMNLAMELRKLQKENAELNKQLSAERKWRAEVEKQEPIGYRYIYAHPINEGKTFGSDNPNLDGHKLLETVPLYVRQPPSSINLERELIQVPA